MVIVGAQYTKTPRATPTAAISNLRKFLVEGAAASQPKHYQLSSVTDVAGAYNEILIAYWQSKAAQQDWAGLSGFDSWWQSLDAETEEHGWFLEIWYPSMDRLETVFSDSVVPEGAAHMRASISGPIREHVYWGSMRDRLPVAQIDEIQGAAMASPGGANADNSLKRRIGVPPRKNLAIIRSGQDWSNTTPHERKLYLDTMHPVLIKGMDFLRDKGEEVGCFSCRFMDVLDSDTQQPGTEKTFGLAYFDDLSSLEGWSKHHKTHLDIFGRFLQYAKELQNNVSLRLFHEVLVLEPEQQFFEYVGCHSKTGMLASLPEKVERQ